MGCWFELVLQVSVVGVLHSSVGNVKFMGVPLFELRDELLFDHIDLLLIFNVLHLQCLELGKAVTVSFLQVLHLLQHDKLFLVNNFLSRLFKGVFLLQLLFTKANLALVLFPIQPHLESINVLFGSIQVISKNLDLPSTLFDLFSLLTDAALEDLTLLLAFEFLEGDLLVNSWLLSLVVVNA